MNTAEWSDACWLPFSISAYVSQAVRRCRKRLVILHVFQLHSDADYIAHRRLWQFLVERMRDDLESRGMRWGRQWSAPDLFNYRAGEPPTAAAAALQNAVHAGR